MRRFWFAEDGRRRFRGRRCRRRRNGGRRFRRADLGGWFRPGNDRGRSRRKRRSDLLAHPSKVRRDARVDQDVAKLNAGATPVRWKASTIAAHADDAPGAFHGFGEGGAAAVPWIRGSLQRAGSRRTLTVPEEMIPSFGTSIQAVPFLGSVVEIEEENPARGLGIVRIAQDFAIDHILGGAFPVRRGPGARLGVVSPRRHLRSPQCTAVCRRAVRPFHREWRGRSQRLAW